MMGNGLSPVSKPKNEISSPSKSLVIPNPRKVRVRNLLFASAINALDGIVR